MLDLSNSGFAGTPATFDMFGGNILATRDDLSSESQFSELVDRLGLTSIRYPGGSLTEQYFDISHPDQPVVSNDNGSSRPFIPLSDVMHYADENSLSVTIVLPTRNFLSDDVDQNGDRFPNLDEASLRSFVGDLVDGKYGTATVEAFEIGNEYWGSGQMSAVEYGRLAAEMVNIIHDELSIHDQDGLDTDSIDIWVQSGTNLNYSRLDDGFSANLDPNEVLNHLNASYDLDLSSTDLKKSGSIDWFAVNNKIIIGELEHAGAFENVDGVTVHIYSKEPIVESHSTFALSEIDKTWHPDQNGLEIAATEWNQSGSFSGFDDRTDYGLYQAHNMLNQMEDMLTYGVDQAYVWPVSHNTPNTLGSENVDGQPNLTPPGVLFSWMSESLPGKMMLDFAHNGPLETEYHGSDADVHAFYGNNEVTFFIASTSDHSVQNIIDASSFFDGVSDVTVRILSVAPGEAPGDTKSHAVVDELSGKDVYEDGSIYANLNPGEIMQITFKDFDPTDGFEAVMNRVDNLLDIQPDEEPPPLDDEDSHEEDDQSNDHGGDFGFGWLLGLLPLLALLSAM